MKTIYVKEQELAKQNQVLDVIDPDRSGPWIPADAKIRLLGGFVVYPIIVGGRKSPRIWSDLYWLLPDTLILRPAVKWFGRAAVKSLEPLA